MADTPERTRLYQEMTKLIVAYAPWRINTHRIRTDMWYPHLVGYRRPLIQSRSFYKYIDIDLQHAVRTRPVEVYLNTGGGVISEADYLGVYIFVERIKRGRDRVNVAGRKWDAIILRPKIPNGGGIFAEKADARMWLSDDRDRTHPARSSE